MEVGTTVVLKMDYLTEKVNLNFLMAKSMKVNLRITKNMARVPTYMQMEKNMWVNSEMI
jgi:hypothetical protein